jgi:plasmid stabilization system protein ParE
VKRLIVSPEAEEDLAAAAGWYERQRNGLGAQFVSVVDEAFGEILEAPLTSPLWRGDRAYRMKMLRRFPYVVFFRCEGDTVMVGAVAHSRRRPGYWSRESTEK